MLKNLLIPFAVAGAVLYMFRDYLFGYLPASGLDFTMNRNDVRIALRNQAVASGYDPDWFDAIALHESNWNMGALNRSGYDGSLYGGAYGPMQMTAKTAQALGFDPTRFLTDPAYAAQAAAKNFDDVKPADFHEACSYWNAGTKNYNSLPATNSFVTDYWPKVQTALEFVQSNPPEV